jgi:putative flippase GtrA
VNRNVPNLSNRSGKLARFAAVTAIATPANLLLYVMLLRTVPWSALWCNLAAATIITPATYAANRMWVWQLDGAGSRRLLAEYWISTIVNVLAASAVVAILERSGASQSALTFAPLATYTALWIGRFAFLDAVLFRTPRLTPSSMQEFKVVIAAHGPLPVGERTANSDDCV